MKGCLTTIIFLLNISFFGSGITAAFIVGTAFYVDYIHAESYFDLPWYYWAFWFFGIIIFFKLLFKGSKYLSEFICSLFTSDEDEETTENNEHM